MVNAVARTVAVLCAVLPALADAQVYHLRVTVQQCDRYGRSCRLTCQDGSAVAIGRFEAGREILLTAAHCVQGKVHAIRVGIDREWVPAVHLGSLTSGGADIAILGVETGRLKCVPVAERPARIGDVVTQRGFPQGREYRCQTATVVQGRYVEPWLVVNVPSIPGESGGAVVNEAGELVGIASATGRDHTLATGVELIRAHLQKTLLGVPGCEPVQEPSRLAPPRVDVPPSSAPAAALTADEIRAIIREELAGLPPGPPGERGPQGPKGDPGPPGADADPLRLQEIERRLAALESTRIRVQIATGDGVVIDEDLYRLMDPKNPGHSQPIQLRLLPKVRLPEGQ